MDEIVKRLTPTKETMNLLFAKSGNNCAFDGCPERLLDQRNRFIAELCHIKAAMPGGQRFDKKQSNDDRRKPDNLILLCRNHHKETDDVDEYPVKRLVEIKRKHEENFSGKPQELSEDSYQSIIQVLEGQIRDKLLEIERLLLRVHYFKLVSNFFEKDDNKFLPSLKLFKDRLFYQTTEDVKLTKIFFEHFKSNKDNIALLTGSPTNGKTTFALNISQELSEKESFDTYYLEMSPDLPTKEIHHEMSILNRFKTFVVLDDIHKNLPLTTEIYSNSEEWENLSFLFLSRIISKEIQEDENGFNLYKVIRLKEQIRNQNITGKFQGIIDAFIQKHSITEAVGDLDTVIKNCSNNLLKLHLILRLWQIEPNCSLTDIDEREFNKRLFRHYLNDLSDNELEGLIEISSIYSLGIEFHVLFNKSSADRIQEAGLIFSAKSENHLYRFGHSQFADLLLSSIIENKPNIDIYRFYKNKDSFKLKQLFQYLHKFQNADEFSLKYPKNLLHIYVSFAQQKQKESVLSLLEDEFIQRATFEFLEEEPVEPGIIKEFYKHLRFISEYHFELFARKYLQTSSTFKTKILKSNDGFEVLVYLLISCYKLGLSKQARHIANVFIDSFKDMILKAKVNSISLSVRLLKNYDEPLSQKILSSLSAEEWAYKLYECPIFIASNSLTEIKRLNSKLAYDTFMLMYTEQLVNEMNSIQFFRIEKMLSEFKEINDTKTKEIFAAYKDYRILSALKKCPASQIGKGLTSLNKINPVKVQNIFEQLDNKIVLDKLKKESLKDAFRIIAELHSVSKEKAIDLLQSYLETSESRDVRDVVDFFNIVHTLENLQFKKRNEYFSQFGNKQLTMLLNQATPYNYASGLNAIKLYDSKLAKQLFHDTTLDLEQNSMSFTALGPILLKLRKIDHTHTKKLMSQMDRRKLIRKATSNNLNFGQVIKTIEELKGADKDQANEILGLLCKERSFMAKAYRLTMDVLINSVISIQKINDLAAKKVFESYVVQHGSKVVEQKVNFKKLCHALNRLNKIHSKLANQILDKFYHNLKGQLMELKFHELTTSLSDLANVSKEKACNLLSECSDDYLLEKAKITKQPLLNNALGELGKIDPKRQERLKMNMNMANT